MKASVRAISVILLLLMLALTCFAGCVWGISAEEMEAEAIRSAQSTFPGCEYVGKQNRDYVFRTSEGIEFLLSEGTVTVHSIKHRTFYSNYFSEVLSHYADQFSEMDSDSVRVSISANKGEAEIYFETKEDIEEAARIFCYISRLCHIDEIDIDTDVITDGLPAVSFMTPIGTFYCRDSAAGEYVCFDSLMLECDEEGVAEWLTEQYEKEFADSENVNQA